MEQVRPRSVSSLLLLLALVAFVGCRPPSDRLPVSGTITLDGVPLDGGLIRFTSKGEGAIQATGAMIQQGVYQIPQEKGLRAGVYHIEISSPDAKAKPVMTSAYPGGPAIPVAPDRIPAEYNVESDKTIEITADGDNEFNYEIVSQANK